MNECENYWSRLRLVLWRSDMSKSFIVLVSSTLWDDSLDSICPIVAWTFFRYVARASSSPLSAKLVRKRASSGVSSGIAIIDEVVGKGKFSEVSWDRRLACLILPSRTVLISVCLKEFRNSAVDVISWFSLVGVLSFSSLSSPIVVLGGMVLAGVGVLTFRS